jgi:hypothetical protein
MTDARPKGASTGRLLVDQLVDRVPGREVVGHDRVDGQLHSIDERRLAGRGLGGERRESPAKKLATAVPAARGVYGEIRTPWCHATIHLRAPYLPSGRVGPTLAVAERIS